MVSSGASKSGDTPAGRRTVLVVTVLAVALFAFAASFYANAWNAQPHTSKNQATNPAVAGCISRCTQMLKLGVDFGKGLCIVEDLNGYGCSVSNNGKSLCNSRDSLPQIVLNEKCEPVGGVGA